MTGLSVLLSQKLADSFARGFFRPLARPSAPIYVDCADRLERASDDGGQLSYEDAVAVVRETIAFHPGAQLDLDEGGDTEDVRVRASKIFNKLLEARWLEDRTASLDERWVLISPAVRPLLRMLRDLAEDDVAELKGFADVLGLICRTLASEGILDPARVSGEEMRATMNGLLDTVQRAIDQIHAVEKIILSFEEKQRRSSTGEMTLRLFYTDFYEGEHIVCYDTLQRGGLLPRLNQARAVVQEAASDPFAKQRLAEGLAAHKKLAEADAYHLAEGQFRRLERALASIRAKAEIIDARVASFNRLSAQRYRYQTEMRGKRPEQVKAFMQAANAQFAGQRFSDIEDQAEFALLCPEVELYFGAESLARARRSRTAVDLNICEAAPGDSFDAQEIIRQRSLYAVTPNRAARLVERLLPECGSRVSSDALPLYNEDDLLDLLAALAFDRARGRNSPRDVRWRVRLARAEGGGLVPEEIPADTVAGQKIDRFILERIA